ncbi:branched-chain amino acid aminotransferase [Parafilimonas sp.]|uniref:branched-chain amino acid aminotransferase n=1 Tax=Parafilimonas sp. TaxID=1969739 RepID=UPI0039E24DC5
MTEVLDINITKTERSRLGNISLEDIPFGKYFTDHMLEADYENGEWKTEIKPYQPLVLDPSVSALHYGQSIFEGIKAFRQENGEAVIFRPYENFKRFNLSAQRMSMPEVPEEIFIEGMRQLIELDKDWIPAQADHSLYIRPFMFATDYMLGVKPSATYKFLIILSPVGPFHAAPMKIAVEEKYTRAAPGGVGFSKNAGNYGGSMYPAAKAKETGYDQVLWTDAFEHKWLQEVGMMNIGFVINNVFVTPALEDTILKGVTRDSIIAILKDMGIKVEERRLNIDEVVEAYKKGTLTEIFGMGTAAVISNIKKLKYQDLVMDFNVSSFVLSPKIKQALDEIRLGKTEDTHGWLFKV